MHSKSSRLILGILGLLAVSSLASSAVAESIPAQVHCYTEQVDLPTKSIVLENKAESPTLFRFFGYIGFIGEARLRLSIQVREAEAGLRLRYASLSMTVQPNVTFGSAGVLTYKDADEMLLPDSNRIILSLSHNYLMPLDFGEGNMSCEVQF